MFEKKVDWIVRTLRTGLISPNWLVETKIGGGAT